MNVWWQARSRRERGLLIGGTLLIAALLGYGLLWTPWQQRLERLRQQVTQLRADLAWMEQAAPRLQPPSDPPVPAGSAPTSGVGLATLIDGSARAAGLGSRISRLEPQADGSLQLWLDNVSFNTLLGWLADLQTQQGIRVSAAEFNRRGAGRVDAHLSLRSG